LEGGPRRVRFISGAIEEKQSCHTDFHGRKKKEEQEGHNTRKGGRRDVHISLLLQTRLWDKTGKKTIPKQIDFSQGRGRDNKSKGPGGFLSLGDEV